MMNKRMTLGGALLAGGTISEAQLAQALAVQQSSRHPLGSLIVQLGFCTETQVFGALVQQARLPTIDLANVEPDSRALAMVDEALMLKHRVLPLKAEGGRSTVITIAIAAPASIEAIDAVRAASGCSRVIAYLAMDSAIDAAFRRLSIGIDPALMSEEERFEIERPSGDSSTRWANAKSDDEKDAAPITLGYTWGN